MALREVFITLLPSVEKDQGIWAPQEEGLGADCRKDFPEKCVDKTIL